MKRIIILILALFLLTATAYAQDADPGDTAPAATIEAVASEAAPVAPDTLPEVEAPAPSAVASQWESIAYVVIGFLIVLLTIDRITGSLFSRKALDIASKYIDPALGQQIYDTAFKRGLEFGLGKAAQTPGTIDDEFWIGVAQSQGFIVTKTEAGQYVLSKSTAG